MFPWHCLLNHRMICNRILLIQSISHHLACVTAILFCFAGSWRGAMTVLDLVRFQILFGNIMIAVVSKLLWRIPSSNRLRWLGHTVVARHFVWDHLGSNQVVCIADRISMHMKINAETLITCLFVLCFRVIFCLDNGLGRTPGMGYNTWNDFECEGVWLTCTASVGQDFAGLV